MFKSKWDERQKMDQLRAEHYAFWTMWWILTADLVYQTYLMERPFAEVWGETLALVAGGVIGIVLTARKGMWDSRIRFGLAGCLGGSAAATVVFSALYAVGKYRSYEACRENVTGLLLPMTAIFGASIFVLCFAALYLTGKYAERRRKKLEKELEKELEDDGE